MSVWALLGISDAIAETAPVVGQQPAPGGAMFSLLPLLIIFVLAMYFFAIRPQMKQAKAQRELMELLKTGDEVMIAGGIMGKVNKITDQYILLEIANNTEISVQKKAILTILPKGTLDSIR